jgi:hypothetical protein
MAKYSHIVPFGLRLQPELKEKLEKEAYGKPKWSLNSEIVKRLEESLTARDELGQFSDGELIDELVKRWGRDNVLIRLGKA